MILPLKRNTCQYSRKQQKVILYMDKNFLPMLRGKEQSINNMHSPCSVSLLDNWRRKK